MNPAWRPRDSGPAERTRNATQTCATWRLGPLVRRLCAEPPATLPGECETLGEKTERLGAVLALAGPPSYPLQVQEGAPQGAHPGVTCTLFEISVTDRQDGRPTERRSLFTTRRRRYSSSGPSMGRSDEKQLTFPLPWLQRVPGLGHGPCGAVRGVSQAGRRRGTL